MQAELSHVGGEPLGATSDTPGCTQESRSCTASTHSGVSCLPWSLLEIFFKLTLLLMAIQLPLHITLKNFLLEIDSTSISSHHHLLGCVWRGGGDGFMEGDKCFFFSLLSFVHEGQVSKGLWMSDSKSFLLTSSMIQITFLPISNIRLLPVPVTCFYHV